MPRNHVTETVSYDDKKPLLTGLTVVCLTSLQCDKKNREGKAFTDMTTSTANSPDEKYFASWNSYKIPFVPQEQLSKDEAIRRNSYYIGHYQAGKLVRFEKYLSGHREWVDDYIYWDNGQLQQRLMKKADGSETLQKFDRNGKIIL